MRKKRIIAGFSILVSALLFTQADTASAVKKSYQYGDVVMNASIEGKSVSAVTFRHWTHRDKYTCRLCHVDLEFSQYPNDTMVLEEDIREGRYCGACHDGKEAFQFKKCAECHPQNKAEAKKEMKQAKKAFYKFKKKMPAATYGNKIDWMQAEADGKIKPKDSLPGITAVRSAAMVNTRDEPRVSKLPGLPDIIFSHSKHVVWNGCGMCHPDIYAIETGKTKMSMKEIIAGEFCGRCHGTVAFPLNDCLRCHSKPVSMK